jgi:two-component system alkaline phosphatase synthesis response regulator PhoP
MQEWFEKRGFEVDVAEDGVEAVEKCQRNEYDIVALDLEMPRLNGVEALEQIKMSHPNLPVAIVTGYMDRFTGYSLNQAAQIFLKPISMHDLEAGLLALLAQPA